VTTQKLNLLDCKILKIVNTEYSIEDLKVYIYSYMYIYLGIYNISICDIIIYHWYFEIVVYHQQAMKTCYYQQLQTYL